MTGQPEQDVPVEQPGQDDANRASALALARAAAGQDLETAGIPVVLVLTGADGPLPASSDAATVADGAALSRQARVLHRVLWPGAPEDDLFATYAVLATVGFAQMGPQPGVPDPAAGR